MFPRVTSCRVAVAVAHRHQQHRKLFTVRLNIMFSGGEVVVTRDNHEEVYVLLRDVFIAARRELEKSVHRRGGGGRLHAERQTEQSLLTLETNNE